MRIAVCGAGYVGLASGIVLSQAGHELRVLDQDGHRVAQLLAGEDPLGEPLVASALRRGRMAFTTEARAAYDGVDAILLAVGTPTMADGSADVSQLNAAAEAVAAHARPCAVMVRSTVPVGTGDRLQTIILRRFRVISNPEFLREGHAVSDSLNPDRIVAGGQRADRDVVTAVYRQVLDRTVEPLGDSAIDRREVPFLWMDRRSAELAKYAANAFLATKLSFVNEMANLAAHVGADIRAVAKAVGTDPRIGPSFLRPGIGWGGSCFPKDTRALASFALEQGYDFRVLRAVIEQNNAQLRRFYDLIKAEIGGRRSARVGLLGLAFKAGTADVRESPAVALVELMLAAGWEVRAFDPAVSQKRAELPATLQLAAGISDAADGADALVIATEWPEFAAADFASLARRMRGRVVIDGRCIVEPATVRAAGLRYVGICAPGSTPD